MINEQDKQTEIKKIVEVCKQNSIQYDINKLDFIEKDTYHPVSLNFYLLLVVRKNLKLEIDGFFSEKGIEEYSKNFNKNRFKEVLYQDNKEIVGYIFINNLINKNIYSPFRLKK